MAAANAVQSLTEEVTCSICLGFFQDPVTLECEHNFCHSCITEYWKGAQGHCPHCREICPTGNLKPNRQLRSIVEIAKQLSQQTVRPQEQNVCQKHEEKLKLFCQEHQTPICVVCDRSTEHRAHTVVPLEEAALQYKIVDKIVMLQFQEHLEKALVLHERQSGFHPNHGMEIALIDLQSQMLNIMDKGKDKFQGYLDDMKKELENILGFRHKEDEKLTDLEVHFRIQRERITSVFTKVQQFLEKEKSRHLSNLEEREKKIQQRIREKVTKLDNQQAMVRDQIKEIESKCQQPDVELLKDVKSLLSRFEKMKFQPPDSGNVKEQNTEAEKNVEVVEGKEEQLDVEKEEDLLQKIIESLEWRWACSCSSEVTLDPDTAHQVLVLSEDGRSVRDGGRAQDLPDTPERFNPVASVLGRERLSSGRHYWEVEVGDKTRWTLGVCDESVSRKGRITAAPKSRYWTVWLRDGEYEALSSPSTSLTLHLPPRVVGLFLDHEAGRLSVYNVTDKSLLFTFSGATFPRTLRPYFNPGLRDGGKNGGALRMLPVTGHE